MIQVVLIEPEIPQNTGNIARTCAATHTPLHLVEPLGFRITDRHLKRAGLDYWQHVRLSVHAGIRALREALGSFRWVCFSARGQRSYHEFAFLPGDCLVFGPETRGLPDEFMGNEPGNNVVNIPIDRTRVRSLNLATTVGVALFEALRQTTAFKGKGIWMATADVAPQTEKKGTRAIPPSRSCF
ncbi:MAG: tRNA (cytidine(34)-2'-O)-methyltransferase [Deltaproteobacteria bacterium]|nr:tRNA (cytidine(34)-2'-O)-methyltransferase [Deltaproteobacteria bacterium]